MCEMAKSIVYVHRHRRRHTDESKHREHRISGINQIPYHRTQRTQTKSMLKSRFFHVKQISSRIECCYCFAVVGVSGLAHKQHI